MDRALWYVFRRLMVLFIGIMVILTWEFVLLRVAPGDPMNLAIPRNWSFNDPEYVQEVYEIFGEPLYVQYVEFIGDMLTGDFHYSWTYHADVEDVIFSQMWRTFTVFFSSLAVCLVLGSLLGRAASRAKTHTSRQLMSLVPLAMLSVSVIAWQWMIIEVFYEETALLPLGGPDTGLAVSIMPALTLFLASFGWFALIIRDGQMRTATASAPGAHSFTDGLFAAMPNLQLIVALSMSFVIPVEVWFGYNGLGLSLLRALLNLDYFLLQACVFLMAATVLLTNFSLETIVTFARPKRRLDLYLREDVPRDATPSSMAAPSAAEPLCVRTEASGVLRDYLKSPVGVVALLALIFLVALAVVGPALSSDEYLPGYYHYSPVKLFLDGARSLVAVSLFVAVLASVFGMAVGIVSGLARPHADWLIMAVMQGVIAVPVLCLLIVNVLARSGLDGLYQVGLILVVPTIALTSMLVCHGVASSRKSMGTDRGASIVDYAPSAASWALSGLKYAVPVAAVALFTSDFLGITQTFSWGNALEVGFVSLHSPAWDYILPPLLGMFLLVGSMFLALDTLERVIRTRFSKAI